MRQSTEQLTASSWIRRGQIMLVSYAAMTYTTLFVRAMWGHMYPDPGDNVTLSAVVALVLAACPQAYKKGDMTAKVFAGAALALLMAETYGTQFYDITDIDDPTRRTYINRLEEDFREPMEFLVSEAARGERFRYAMSPDLSGTNVGARWGIEQTGGFLASINRDFFEMYVQLNQIEFYKLTNTKYFIGRGPHDEAQIERFTARNGIKVFENPDTLPRAWMTYSNEFVSDARFESSGLQRVASCETEGQVRQTAWTIQSTTLEVETACPGYVVLADPYFEGWQATVDGAKVPVLRYRRGLRAVYAPTGRSTVEFRYRPQSVTRGAWMTGFGFLLCCGAGLWLRFRAPRLA
ncbi:MAG: YfhO family protein [Acidobacteria bacterium]|nr:YfhO family protein [Acidobacteriota bacterium]MDA1233908.1 YfhO family protein [Acidobacteriota bacterium]